LFDQTGMPLKGLIQIKYCCKILLLYWFGLVSKWNISSAKNCRSFLYSSNCCYYAKESSDGLIRLILTWQTSSQSHYLSYWA